MTLTLILNKFSDKLHCRFLGVLVWIGFQVAWNRKILRSGGRSFQSWSDVITMIFKLQSWFLSSINFHCGSEFFFLAGYENRQTLWRGCSCKPRMTFPHLTPTRSASLTMFLAPTPGRCRPADQPVPATPAIYHSSIPKPKNSAATAAACIRWFVTPLSQSPARLCSVAVCAGGLDPLGMHSSDQRLHPGPGL